MRVLCVSACVVRVCVCCICAPPTSSSSPQSTTSWAVIALGVVCVAAGAVFVAINCEDEQPRVARGHAGPAARQAFCAFCNTKNHVPVGLTAGAKVRCSVCQRVFAAPPAKQPQQVAAAPMQTPVPVAAADGGNGKTVPMPTTAATATPPAAAAGGQPRLASCPSCQTTVSISAETPSGTTMQCPSCQQLFAAT